MITIIMPYYDNPEMLALHYAEWSKWPQKLRDEYKFIIVDDGSPNSPAADVERPRGIGIGIYRVTEDRPWHQHGARNLGAHVALDGEWLVLTDMDHMLERGPADGLLYRIRDRRPALGDDMAYMFQRIEADTRKPTRHPKNGEHKPHPNSFLMTKELYWRVGGYDEDFCGIYGTDSLFRGRLPQPVPVLDVPLVRYHREIIADASTRTLQRKEDTTRSDRRRKVQQRKAINPTIKTLAFPWERVC